MNIILPRDEINYWEECVINNVLILPPTKSIAGRNNIILPQAKSIARRNKYLRVIPPAISFGPWEVASASTRRIQSSGATFVLFMT